MVLALVEPDLRVLEILLLGPLDLGGAGRVSLAGERGDHFRAAPERESAAVHLDLSFRAEEIHAESALVFQDDAVGIDEFGPLARARFFRRQNLDRAAAVHAQAPLGDVEVVRAPVGNAPAAELPVAAPGGIMLVDPARAQRGVVRPHPGGPHPKVPVEPRFHRLLGEVARNRRTAEATLHALDLADRPVEHQLARHAEFFRRSLHRARLQHAPVRVDLPQENERLVDIVRQRLLAIHVLPAAEGRHGDHGVPVVGRGDRDGVDVLAARDLAEVVICRALAAAPRLLGVVLDDAPLGVVAAGRVHVANRQDLRVAPEEPAQKSSVLHPHAHKAHRQPRVRLGLGRPDVRRQKERRRRRRSGCPLEKRSSRNWHCLFLFDETRWPFTSAPSAGKGGTLLGSNALF